MTATVTAKPAPTDIAIDTETGQIGTVAELEAAGAVMPPAAVEVVKPDTVPRDVVAEAKPAAVEAPAAEAETAPAPNAAAEAAARLRARGAARRSRIDREAQVRGVQSTLERRLADTARALKDAEARAAEAERQTLPALQARGEAGKALAQAAVIESTPEAIAQRALETATAATKRLEAYEAAEAQRKSQEQIASGRDKFARYATEARELDDNGKPSDVAAFPFVALRLKRDRDATMTKAEGLIRTAQARGYRPTFDQVLQHLNDEFGAEYAEAAKLVGGASTVAEAETVPPATKPAAKAGRGAATLTKSTQVRAAAGRRFEDLQVRNTARDGGTDEQIEYIMELARREAAQARG